MNERRRPVTNPPEPSAAVQGESWETFYRDNWPWIYRAVRRLGGPSIEVDDAVQDVFLVLIRRLDTFEGRSTLKTWIYRVCINVTSEHRRRVHRRDRLDRAVRIAAFWRAPTTPDREVEARDELALVRSILEKLPEKKREVFVLCELEELPRTEVAQLLNIPEATVRTRLFHAKKAFKKHLERARGPS